MDNPNINTYQKHLSEPWFKLIRSGHKTYEGRLYRGDWTRIRNGDRIIFQSKGQTVRTQVSDLLYYEDVYDDLGSDLIPH